MLMGYYPPSMLGGGTGSTWATLSGKPSVFPPEAHTQGISSVTGLQTALDGKQAAGSYALTSHTHTGVYQPAGSYAAAVHTHVIADTTGLQAALDGKQAAGSYSLTSHNHAGVYAPVSHTHIIADVTGLQAALDAKQAAGTYLTAFGYSTGSGGAVTQATNKSTAVTLNKLTGEITMNAAALAAGAIATFVLNNSLVVAGDMLVTSHHAGGTVGPYLVNGRVTGNGACSIAIRNTSAASLSEAVIIKFSVIKAVTA